MSMKCFVALACAVVALCPGSSQACGGCFAPPSSVSVVTDHRMVLSLSTSETILWDQIRYAGSPSEFSWILPIRYTSAVRVEVASDGFLTVADGFTSPILDAPPCGTLPWKLYFTATSNGGVTVRQSGVVGPYSMSVISGRDPTAIRRWLAANGYSVPAAVAPVIERYTDLSMDFVVLRLRPGEGIDRMSPVRIRMPGYMPSLPLRMIAAGAGDRVGLSLIVLSGGRVEAQNFPNAEISDADLSWDWRRPGDPARDLLAAFDVVNSRNGGRAWITESATLVAPDAWTLQAADLDDPALEALPSADVRIALSNCGASCFATRLRAVLPRAALDQDLALGGRASAPRPRWYRYGNVTGEASDAVCERAQSRDAGAPIDVPARARDGATPTADASEPADDASLDGGDTPVDPVEHDARGGTLGCAASPTSPRGGWAALAPFAAVFARLRRRDRSTK